MDPYLRPLTIFDLVDDPTLDTSPIYHSMPPKDILKPVFLTLATGVAVVAVLLACPDFLSGKEADTYLPLPVAETGRLDVSLPFDAPPTAPSGPR